MIRKSLLLITVFLAVMGLTGSAFGGANDYAFEPVQAEIKASNVATIGVRLVRKQNGKPVTHAVMVQTRLIMLHEGSTEMASAIASLPSPKPGVYAFRAPMMMAGGWTLSLAAKVRGEPEMVTGTIRLHVVP